jgi:hypothetical protein
METHHILSLFFLSFRKQGGFIGSPLDSKHSCICMALYQKSHAFEFFSKHMQGFVEI